MSTVRIQVRRGTAAQWASINPILAAGEMGLESDTNYIKFGDGAAVWNDLPYAGDNLAQLQNSLEGTYVLVADVGQPNGVASLNSSGKVPASQLDINEFSQDLIADTLLQGSNMSISYDDAAGRITVAVNANPSFTSVNAATGNLDDITSTGTITATNVNISGDLTVTGTTTTVNSTDLSVTDPMIYMGEGNSSAVLDLGFVAAFDNGTYQHTGLVRDASDSTWKLFSGVTTEPSTTVDFTTYTKDDLEVGALIANGAKIGAVLNNEIQRLSGVTGNIQDQLDAKADLNSPTFTGTVTLPIGTIKSDDIDSLAVGTAKIVDLAVTEDKIATGAVTALKLADSAVETAKINELAVVSGKIADSAVISSKIDDGAVNADKIAALAITDTHISNTAAITPSKIDGIAVTQADTATVTNTMLAGEIAITKVDGLQTALDTKAPKVDPTFTGNVALPSTTSIGDVSATEISYVNGVTSAIQTQINDANSALTTHNLDTTNVHGIADTSVLATQTDVSTAQSNAETFATGAISTHNSDTTSVHGIADTSKIVLTDAISTTLDGGLVVSGNLTVNGTTTTVNTSNFTTSDPVIYLAEGNTANTVDLGFVASYNDGTYAHQGLVKDASDNKWKFFKGVTDEPTTTVNFGQGSLDDVAVNNLTAAGVVFTDGTQTKAGVPSITNIPTAEASSFTLGANRADEFIPLNGAVTVTLPSSGYVKGQSIDFWQETSTGAQFTGTGVVGTPGLKLRTTNSVATAMKTASGWLVFGDLSA